MKGIRTNRWSDGRSLVNQVLLTADLYSQRRILYLKKVDPPVRVFGSAGQQRVCFQRNPFVDTIGSWTERGGRTICIECKSTQEPVLQLAGGRDGASGLSKSQIETLFLWENYGAATGIIWGCCGKNAWISMATIRTSYPIEKHLHFRDCAPIPQGEGFILIDFAANLRANYPV